METQVLRSPSWSILLILLSLIFAGCTSTSTVEKLPVEKTVFVGPHRVDCTGVGPQKCFLIKDSPGAEWTYLYDEIEGFDYEEGYTYELRVREHYLENPPADASSIKLILVENVSKTPTTSHPETSGGEVLLRQWVLHSFDVIGSESSVRPHTEITLTFTDRRIHGSGGCNRYFGGYQGGEGNTLSIQGVGSTKMFCPGRVMDQERRYFEALLNTSTFWVDQNQLQLFYDNGRRVLNFVERD
ncbi:MAG: DUF4377 domain-containing protein [Nitrospiraceae bacterium]